LATEIHLRNDILKKYGIQPCQEELVRRLQESMSQKLQLSEEELYHARNNALRKLIEIVKNDLIDEAYDQQELESVKDFLVYFLTIDPPNTYNLLEELLAIPLVKFHETDTYGLVIKFWREPSIKPKTDTGEKISETEKMHEEESRTYGEITQKPKIAKTELEKKPAKRHDGLSEEQVVFFSHCLEDLKRNNISKPLNTAQITKFFPRLKATKIDWMCKKGYVKPENSRDGHPVFTPAEILVMLFVLDQGNHINNQRIKKLRKNIEDWLARENADKKED